jgi:glycerol-3-phosphate cytidylyltransferase
MLQTDLVIDRTVYNGGTYDMLHYGHLNMLQKCRNYAGYDGKVVIALNTDEFVMQFKHHMPVMTYDERRKNLMATGLVDRVIRNTSGADSKPTILKVKPDIIVVGSDWARKDYCKQMGFTWDWLDEHHIELVYVNYTWGICSSDLRERLLNRGS